MFADVNECKTVTCIKYSKCVNIPGSYYCNCTDGYEYNEMNDTCVGKELKVNW